jgi:siroheme synthase
MTVYLVGAGPGDPELMTKRSLDLIAAADVIIYDRLVPDGALSGAPAEARPIFVGKEGGGEQVAPAEIASAVAFLTGHEDPSKPESALDWRALAAFPGTLCVYMGVRQLEGIAAKLIDGGRSADEPAALIQRGTWPGQRTVVATLGTIAAVGREQKIGAGDRPVWPCSGTSSGQLTAAEP